MGFFFVGFKRKLCPRVRLFWASYYGASSSEEPSEEKKTWIPTVACVSNQNTPTPKLWVDSSVKEVRPCHSGIFAPKPTLSTRTPQTLCWLMSYQKHIRSMGDFLVVDKRTFRSLDACMYDSGRAETPWGSISTWRPLRLTQHPTLRNLAKPQGACYDRGTSSKFWFKKNVSA